MTSLRQAAQHALEALDVIRQTLSAETVLAKDLASRADALRAALAEPVQEPVAWMYDCGGGGRMYAEELDDVPGWAPLYTAPPQSKPLSEEEIEKAYREIWRNLPSEFDHTASGWIEMGIRYAERAHGIK